MAEKLSLLTVPAQSNLISSSSVRPDNRLEDEDGEIVSLELSQCGKMSQSKGLLLYSGRKKTFPFATVGQLSPQLKESLISHDFIGMAT